MIPIGTRVSADGDIGHVEEYDPNHPLFITVRILTPNNEPSAVCSTYWLRDVVPVGENVIPMPKSAEWWEESRQFCAAIEAALIEEVEGRQGR